MKLGDRAIDRGGPCYIIAELSCNHGGVYEYAVRLIHRAKAAGADAVKFQHYTPETMVGAADTAPMTTGPWAGRTKRDLYAASMMPWEWTGDLIAECRKVGLPWLSTPYDPTALAFLESYAPMAYKVASFELTDVALLRLIAATGRPAILSTGMATLPEIATAVATLRANPLALLHCVSAYPTPPEAANLPRMEMLARYFGLPVGFSDHTTGFGAACAAVTLGAAVLEKHIMLHDEMYLEPTADAAFSLNPRQFAHYVAAVREAEAAGRPAGHDVEAASHQFRRASGGWRGSYAPS